MRRLRSSFCTGVTRSSAERARQALTTAWPFLRQEADVSDELRAKATALQQHPELAGSGSVRFSIPKTVLYASLRGEGDGQRIALPSLRISAIPSRRDLLDPNFFSQQTQRVAASSGMKAVSPASQFTVNDHQFLRADFERTSGPSRICYSYVQTLARDYLLVIELFASSPEELQQIAAFLQSVSITGDVP